jgi:hypothetical protein
MSENDSQNQSGANPWGSQADETVRRDSAGYGQPQQQWQAPQSPAQPKQSSWDAPPAQPQQWAAEQQSVQEPQQQYPEQPAQQYPQQQSAQQQQWGQQNTAQLPYNPSHGQQGGQIPPGWGAPPATTDGAGSGRPKGKIIGIAGLAVVVLAALGIGGYVILKPDAPKFTYQGKAIAHPEQVVANAEKSVGDLVTKRHGAKDADTRCYFAIPEQPAAGAKKTDVNDTLACGPVLFVDGNTSKPYLAFPLSVAGTAKGKVNLNVAAPPKAADPATLPTGTKFVRPDQKAVVSGAGSLTVPAPPPAEMDVLAAMPLAAGVVPAAPGGAAAATPSNGVKITALGAIKRYGAGDSARSAPTGQQLIAFKVQDQPGLDDSYGSGDLTIRIDGGAGKAVPDTTEYVVFSAPTAAKRVDLNLTEGGTTQSISLLTGKPAATNIALGTRTNRADDSRASHHVSIHLAKGGVTADAGATIGYAGAKLEYTAPNKTYPSNHASALLFVDVTITHDGETTDYGLNPGLVTMTIPGSHQLHAVNKASAADHVYLMIQVPATFTRGTLHIGGSVVEDGITETFRSTATFTVSIKAG